MPYAEIDGLRLHYERAGRGDPELLFIPGWCCDGTSFQPQFDRFAQEHAVTALDLRGCGKSDRPPHGYRIRDLADDVAGFCRVMDIDRPIVVGHSTGGMIAVELGARRPSLPRALVLLDPGPIQQTPETIRFLDAFPRQLAGPDGEEVRRRYVKTIEPRDAALARAVMDMMCAVPLPVATAFIQHIIGWDGAGELALCEAPTLLLRPAPDAETDAPLLEIKPDMTLGITVGAGHFHQLEVPDQVNAMINRFLELAAPYPAR